MRLIDADKIVLDYSGLAHIPPNDFVGIAKYFYDQIKAIPTIATPPNDPLTMDELREMDGEPVYVRYFDGAGEFGLVETYGCEYAEIRFRNGVSTVGGKHGLFSRGAEIYRRKPEGDAK